MDMRHMMRLVEALTPATIASNANFRRWFGASKVVDASHAPLVVHHGSNAHAYSDGQIEMFHTGGERGAAFFTSNARLAREYGERLYDVYLRIENPLVVHGDGKHWEALTPDTRIDGQITDKLRAHHQKQAADLNQLYAEFADLGLSDGESSELKSQIADHATSLKDHTLRIIAGDERQSTDAIVKLARRFGYDGVIFHNVKDSPTSDTSLYNHQNSDIYAVFSAAQVKSATQNSGAFSRDDPDIRA